MPRVKLQDIERPLPRRLGAQVQRDAVAPFPERHDGDHWNLNRRPWVHPFFPGRASCRTGRKTFKACIDAEIQALAEGELTDLVTEDVLPSAAPLSVNQSRRCREIYNRVRTAGRPGYLSFADGERDALQIEDASLGCNVFSTIFIRGGFETIFPVVGRNDAATPEARFVPSGNQQLIVVSTNCSACTSDSSTSQSLPAHILRHVTLELPDDLEEDGTIHLTNSVYGDIIPVTVGQRGANKIAIPIPTGIWITTAGSSYTLTWTDPNSTIETTHAFISIEPLNFSNKG